MISGKMVKLRPIEEADLPFTLSMFNDPVMRINVVGWSFPVSMNSHQKWFQGIATGKNDLRLIIETYEGESIGLTGLSSIDWHNRNAISAIKLKGDNIQGKGYGRDAIMTMNAFAFFDVGLNRLYSSILDFNVPSYKAYVEKSGWQVEGKLRKHVFRNGAYRDLYYVGCLKEDFLAVSDAGDYIPPEIPARLDCMDLFK